MSEAMTDTFVDRVRSENLKYDTFICSSRVSAAVFSRFPCFDLILNVLKLGSTLLKLLFNLQNREKPKAKIVFGPGFIGGLVVFIGYSLKVLTLRLRF